MPSWFLARRTRPGADAAADSTLVQSLQTVGLEIHARKHPGPGLALIRAAVRVTAANAAHTQLALQQSTQSKTAPPHKFPLQDAKCYRHLPRSCRPSIELPKLQLQVDSPSRASAWLSPTCSNLPRGQRHAPTPVQCFCTPLMLGCSATGCCNCTCPGWAMDPHSQPYRRLWLSPAPCLSPSSSLSLA